MIEIASFIDTPYSARLNNIKHKNIYMIIYIFSNQNLEQSFFSKHTGT